MRRFIGLVSLFCLTYSLTIYAEDVSCCGDDYYASTPPCDLPGDRYLGIIPTCRIRQYRVDASLAAGIRHDSVKWSIQGPDGIPNILSDLKWTDLKMYAGRAELAVTTPDHIYLRGRVEYGKIFHGEHSDNDYLGDDRTFPFLLSEANADRGEAFDFTGGIGYRFDFVGQRVSLTPIVGYAYHAQHLRQRDLFIEFNLFDPFDVGPVPGLHSNYRSSWYGPWVGLDFIFKLTHCLVLFGSGEYHMCYFRAKGHWNLRTDFLRDFRQHADAFGQVYILGLRYFWARRWSLGLVGSIYRFRSHRGEDKVFLAIGPIESKLNPVKWHSYSVMGELAYHY